MKKFKIAIILLVYSLLILTLFSCGVNKKNSFSDLFSNEKVYLDDAKAEESIEEIVYEEDMAVAETAAATGAIGGLRMASKMKVAPQVMNSYVMTDSAVSYDAGDYGYSVEEPMAEPTENGAVSTERKLIKTVDISAETTEFDETIEWFKSYVASFDGIIDNSYVDSGNKTNKRYRKNSHFTVRIPAEKLDAFLMSLGNNINITYQQENVQDVTDQYDDRAARKQTLIIEEAKLNELMTKAKNVEDMINIEDKLSQVRYELQNVDRTLKRLDKQIVYSTVNLSIVQVINYTEEPVEVEDFSFESLKKQLKKNFDKTIKFVAGVGAYIFTHIPAILLLVVIIVLVLAVLKTIKNVLCGKKVVDNVVEKTVENVNDTVEKVVENVNDTAEKVVENVNDVAEKVVDKVDEAIDKNIDNKA